MSSLSPSRVASLYLTGGIFEGPPRLEKAIREWAQSVYAGHVLAHVLSKIPGMTNSKRPHEEALAKMEEVEQTYENRIRSLRPGEAVKFYVPKAYDSGPVHTYVGVKRWEYESNLPYQVAEGERAIPYKTADWRSLDDTIKAVHFLITARKERLLRTIRMLERYEKDNPLSEKEDRILVELHLLKNECLKYTDAPKSYSTKAEREIPVDLEGWKYLDRWLAEVNRRREVTNKGVLEAIELAERTYVNQVKYHPVAKAIAEALDEGATEADIRKLIESHEADHLLPNLWRAYLFDPPREPTLTLPGDSYTRLTTESARKRLQPPLTRETLGEHLEKAGHDTIRAILWFKSHTERGGQWTEMTRTLEVDATNTEALSVKAFRAGLTVIAETTRHEVQHVGQSFLSFGKADGKDKWEGGMPSPHLRNPEYDANGLTVKWQGGKEKRQVHELRDTEFYTDLADAIDGFERVLQRIDPKDRAEAVRAYVGLPSGSPYVQMNKHFSVWRREDKAKWRKAVSELVKAVGDRGIRVGPL